jgi:hypothetical protein
LAAGFGAVFKMNEAFLPISAASILKSGGGCVQIVRVETKYSAQAAIAGKQNNP